MTTKKDKNSLTEQEKQVTPMPGETEPDEAFVKARLFANKEKVRLQNKSAGFKKR